MPTQSSPAALIEKLKMPGAALDPAAAAQIELSPPLVLAAALLYMMLSNGEVEKSEIDQLQSVIGKNADLLRCAVDYVQSVPVEQFIADAPEILGTSDKLCVLTNLCDAMLSDGQADAVELELLARLTDAFGFSDEEFQPYFEAITLKNDKTVLGMFDTVKLATQQATPHLAMAASLIYMMASDGSLGPEEIGRLQNMIGEFEGLQKVAVKYALKVKSEKFFASAARFLNPEQKIFILTNVCDIMLADGVVEAAEKVVFQNMRTAFGYSEEEFIPFHDAVTAKNTRTFETNTFTYARDSRLADDGDPDDIFGAPGISFGASANSSTNVASGAKLGASVSRAMRANIVKVSSDFGSTKKLNRIASQSTSHADARNEIPAIKFKPRQDEQPQDLFADTGPSASFGRRPIGSGGRGAAPIISRALPQARGVPMHGSSLSNDPAVRSALVIPSQKPGRPAPARKQRSPTAPEEIAQAAKALDSARNRLQQSQAASADIHKQLDHYEATGKKAVPSPLVKQMGQAASKAQTPQQSFSSTAITVQPTAAITGQRQSASQARPEAAIQNPRQAVAQAQAAATAPGATAVAHPLREAAMAQLRHRRHAVTSQLGQIVNSMQQAAASVLSQDKAQSGDTAAENAKATKDDPRAHATTRAPAWRTAVPVAVLASALLVTTVGMLTHLGSAQPDVGWAPVPADTASLAPCIVSHAMSKQAWLPRAASGCWSIPQPQSMSASVARVARNVARARFL